jgi:nicotinate-nucleotide adenylyltransferase
LKIKQKIKKSNIILFISLFRNIAIFGGSFDPPTLSHMILACEIYNQLDNIDEVWIAPCGDGRVDKNIRCDINHRIKMLELIKQDIVYGDLPVYINDTEKLNGMYMPTWNLLTKLQEDYQDYTFSFCFGSDLVKGLPNWEYGKDIIEKFDLVVLSRPGYDYKDVDYINKCKILETNFDNSSTRVRQRIEEVIKKKHKVHLAISGLTSRSILQYIYENNLYKVESSCKDTYYIGEESDCCVGIISNKENDYLYKSNNTK